jgi:hypothetical protein
MATVRKQILLDAEQNKRLRQLRATTGVSESEIVRRALEAYDPENAQGLASSEEVRELLDALVAQNAKTADVLSLAEAEIAATEHYLAELRGQRGEASAVARHQAESAAPAIGRQRAAGAAARKRKTARVAKRR